MAGECVEGGDGRLRRVQQGELREDLLRDVGHHIPRTDSLLFGQGEDNFELGAGVLETKLAVGGAQGVDVLALGEVDGLVDLVVFEVGSQRADGEDAVPANVDRLDERNVSGEGSWS